MCQHLLLFVAHTTYDIQQDAYYEGHYYQPRNPGQVTMLHFHKTCFSTAFPCTPMSPKLSVNFIFSEQNVSFSVSPTRATSHV
jgi:hypothetical protein